MTLNGHDDCCVGALTRGADARETVTSRERRPGGQRHTAAARCVHTTLPVCTIISHFPQALPGGVGGSVNERVDAISGKVVDAILLRQCSMCCAVKSRSVGCSVLVCALVYKSIESQHKHLPKRKS